MNSLDFMLLVILLFSVSSYLYIGTKNQHKIKVFFLGREKEVTVRHLIWLSLSEGIVVGMFLAYFLLKFS